MKSMPFSKLAILLFCFVLNPVTGQVKTSPSGLGPGFSLTLKAPGKTFRIGDEVLLYAIFTNITGHDIYFTRTPGYDNPEFSYYFSILDEHGNNKESLYSAHVHEKSGRPHMGSSQVVDTIGPEASIEMKIHLNRIADLDKSGRYTIQISRNDRSTGNLVTSNTVAIDLVTEAGKTK